MRGARVLTVALLVFAAGLGAALYGVTRYHEAYSWVEHTSDVRLVIGRAVGHARSSPSCDGLRRDAAELAELTEDNRVQQDRMPLLRTSIELACSGHSPASLIEQLAELDATERGLTDERRTRLMMTRTWTILSFVLSTVGALAAFVIARFLQQGAVRALASSEERFRLMAMSSRDLMRIHDPQGRPTYVSPSVEALLGFTQDEVLAAVPLSLGHPDDMERMQQTLTEIQRDHATGSTLVYRLRRKDGVYRWFETHTNPIRDDHGKLLHFYTTARDITDRVDLEKKLELAAVTDELTGLLNRRGFLMMAGQEHRLAMRQQHGIAVIFADLDGLKTINDKLGHDHGDQAIAELAKILRNTFRESDVVARLGGDEFAALAYNVDQVKLDFVLDRLSSAVASAPAIGPYPLSVSLGVALLAPGDTSTLDDLIAEADQRMYEHKRARKAAAGQRERSDRAPGNGHDIA